MNEVRGNGQDSPFPKVVRFFYEKYLIILTTIAEHGGSYCQRAVYNTAPFCHHLPKASTLVGVCNSLLSPRHPQHPRNRVCRLDFGGGGHPSAPTTTHEIERVSLISGVGTPFSATTREIERADLILRVGDSLLPTTATREIGHDFGGGGLPSVSSTPTTCEIEHLGLGIVTGYPGVLGVSDLIELFPRIF